MVRLLSLVFKVICLLLPIISHVSPMSLTYSVYTGYGSNVLSNSFFFSFFSYSLLFFLFLPHQVPTGPDFSIANQEIIDRIYMSVDLPVRGTLVPDAEEPAADPSE